MSSGAPADRWPDPQAIRRRLQALGNTPELGWHASELLGAEAHPVEAGVLIPLFERGGEFWAVFTKRQASLRQHSGEVSFPGGRRDPGDVDTRATALRESFEEIGLEPQDVEVYGALMTMPTVTNYQITAWVGEFAHPYQMEPNPAEIEVIFEAPLRLLADPERSRVERREFGGQRFQVHFFEYEEFVIWGATGRLLRTLLDYLLG